MVSREITSKELEDALAAAVDGEGNDVRLAQSTARMTEEERRLSDDNIRRWARGIRATLGVDSDPSDAV